MGKRCDQTERVYQPLSVVVSKFMFLRDLVEPLKLCFISLPRPHMYTEASREKGVSQCSKETKSPKCPRKMNPQIMLWLTIITVGRDPSRDLKDPPTHSLSCSPPAGDPSKWAR